MLYVSAFGSSRPSPDVYCEEHVQPLEVGGVDRFEYPYYVSICTAERDVATNDVTQCTFKSKASIDFNYQPSIALN